MAAKDFENNQWTDPKDYGLPFVEITPLHAKSNPNEKDSAPTIVDPASEHQKLPQIPIASEVEVESSPAEKPVEVESKEAEEPAEIETNQIEKPVEIEVEKVIPPPVSPKAKEKKKTASWVWAVFILAFGIVSFIIWQIQSQTSSTANVLQSETPDEPTESESSSTEDLVPESTITDQNQTAVNQYSIPSVINSNPNISKPAETGTTIANIASGNLIRIESKAERPQYFIIVGSLPNERLAIEEASQYFSKTPEMYLISPEEGSRNYRLALSKFGSFRLAAEELEQIKAQYTEELWILKY